MGLLRLVHPGSKRFRSTLSDAADHAGSRDRRREVIGGDARATDEIGRSGSDRRRAEGYRTLVARGAAERDDGRAGKVSLTPPRNRKEGFCMIKKLFIATLSLGAASAVIGQSLPEMRM